MIFEIFFSLMISFMNFFIYKMVGVYYVISIMLSFWYEILVVIVFFIGYNLMGNKKKMSVVKE